ncbi:hypothetical protein [Micromonospora sp. DT227]|uniref:hypothetical protein n=1 Tax=Micromonospora sp. DT227 TaxID=3393433 RepID=UPI003CF7AFD0
MTAPLDPETAALANSFAVPYERYLHSGRQADFDEARALAERAVARARAGGFPALPGLLFNLSHVHVARYRWTRDREALGEAYGLLVEAAVRDPDQADVGDRLISVAQSLLGTIDHTSPADMQWYVQLHRQLLHRVPGDHFMIWSNLALALRGLLDVDDDTGVELMHSFGQANERAATLSPSGSPAAGRHWDHAARVLPFLAGMERDAGLARRAARACEMAMHERPDDPSAGDRTILLLLSRVLAYEAEGRDADRDAVRALLSSLTRMPSAGMPPGLAPVAQDVVASLLRRFHRHGDVAAREQATEFAIWCVRRMEFRADVRHAELPGMLNALGACLAARPGVPSRPVPWSGWPPGSGPMLRRVPGAATALASRHPFRISPTVTAPTGKIYLDETFSVVAAAWHEPVKGHALTHIDTALLLPPESGRAAQPVLLPTNLHVVSVDLTAPAGEITAVRAVVESREPHHRGSVDSLMCGPESSAPADAGGRLRPMVNLLLDFDQPLVWPAFEAVTVPRTLVVRAVTENSDVRWRLELDWRSGRRSGTLAVPLRTTGETGMRSFVAGGEVVRASGHVAGLIEPEDVDPSLVGTRTSNVVDEEPSGRGRDGPPENTGE